VIRAAIRLFAQQGFQGTTTKQIAESAGVNEALIFRYFHSKQELYSAILDHECGRLDTERWIEELSATAESRDDEALFRALAHRLVRNYPGKREIFRLTLYSALERHELARMFRKRQMIPLVRFLEEYVRSRQREGGFESLDAHGVAHGFICMCNHHALLNMLFANHPAGLSEEQAIESFAGVFLRGLRRRDVRERKSNGERAAL
jgi:AcrR family transcriptional regulator